MADLPEEAIWRDGIYQLETTDPVVGGPPNRVTKAGVDNVPHQELAERTLWLRDAIEAIQAALQEGLTPEAILQKLRTVDGAGSQLDADLLDGQQGASYQRPPLTQSDSSANLRTTSWDTLNETGFFNGENLPGETPFRYGNGRVAVMSIAHAGTNRTQIAFFREMVSYRTYSLGAWQAWRLLVGHEQGAPPPFALSYQSAELSIGPGARHTLEHGLGRLPKMVVGELVCRTGQHGYSAGERLGPLTMSGALDGDTSLSHSFDETNIRIRLGAAGSVFAAHGTSGQRITLANDNWRLVVRAYS